MHFTFSEINTNARYVNYVESVEFVAESMIGNMCVNVTMPDVLMELYADRRNFKLYMGDTGLLVSQMIREGEETETIYRALIYDKLSSNLGMIFENVVAQMLTANGNNLFYHTFKSEHSEHKREVDFLIARKNKICPIEVKSSGYKSHISLDEFCQKYSSRILAQYLVYTKDYLKNDALIYLPVYMVPFL